MEAYLKQYHDQEITDLLNNPNDLLHVSIHVNLTHLNRKQSELFARILQNTDAEGAKWNECLLRAQKSLIEGNLFLEPGFQIKENCHVRFVNMPLTPAELRRAAYPTNDNVGQFLQVKGSVIRMTSCRFLEYKREYSCTRCKRKVLLEAEYGKSYVFDPPGPCPGAREAGCRGQLQPVSVQPQPEHCRDYQEIRIQEIMSERNVPASLVVTLEDDLVDICQPGDCVTVCGRIEHRWKPPVLGRRTEITITMRANSVTREESKASWAKDLPEHLLCVQAEWQELLREIGELAARDLLVQSIAPAIRGMYPVKLAIALALASCSERPGDAEQPTATAVRGHSHLLLVGDPGLAKSQLLKFASEIASRAVYTTGMGCSSAGLTAAAVKDEGEWQLEAGALVLADGGICCIDEFNLMRETDKASIHEAMEQQTISVAKAGMVCKLSTRCVVLAATNPKNLYTMSDGEATSAANIGIGGPLLSRFDIVLILRDIRAADWDADIASHLLTLALRDDEKQAFGDGEPGRNGMDQFATWELEQLQLHFAAIKDIHPRVSTEANMILGAYYKACRSDPFRDPARTTVRLLDSLFRLSQAHARLLFRSEVTPIDAITVVQLMEASWGFGKIGIPQYDLIKAELPLGPDQSVIDRLMGILNLIDMVQDAATVRPIDANILRRYHRQMVAKKKKLLQEADRNDRKNEENCSGTPGMTQPTVVPCFPSQPVQFPVPEPGADAGVSPHSNYAFRPKANLKKLRKAPPNETSGNDGGVEMEQALAVPKKRKRPATEVDEDLSLKAPLDETALGSLLGSLRRNFDSRDDLTEDTSGGGGGGGGSSSPPAHIAIGPTESVFAGSPVTTQATGKSYRRQDKDISFSALLDTSKIFEDEDDDDFENALSGAHRPVPPLGPAHSLLSKPIVLDLPNVSNGRDEIPQTNPMHLDDTVPNTNPYTAAVNDGNEQTVAGSGIERSVYQIQRPSQRKGTTAIIASSTTQLPIHRATPDEEDDLLSFEIEPSGGDCPLLNGTETTNSSTPYDVPGIRTQAREKLKRFEYHSRHNAGHFRPLEDDSAYASIMLRGGPGQTTARQRTVKETGSSQYSGLLNDGDEKDDSDIEFHLSDIE